MKQLPALAAALTSVAVVSLLAIAHRDPFESERAQWRERYQTVVGELASADTSTLTSEQRTKRATLVRALESYADRSDFGVQTAELGARVPQFVDDGGRRCAMAELLHVDGRDDLVETVHAQRNDAWVLDLQDSAPFREWLDGSGLSLDEAARIQAPAMHPPARPTPATPGAPTPQGPRTPAGPTTTPIGAVTLFNEVATWWMWWEYNKVEFLRPNRLAMTRTPTDGDIGRTFASQLDFVRRSMVPAIERSLHDPDARVRAAAARALGRIGGPSEFEALVELVDDTNVDVRDMTLLALGATGAPKAQELLLEAAREGHLLRDRSVDQRTRAVAVLGLALGRKVAFDASLDDAVAQIYAKNSGLTEEPLRVAAMTYTLIAPSDPLLELAARVAEDRGETPPVRSRAAEALRVRNDSKAASELQHLASGSRIELRRSAALALGEVGEPLVAAALMTAHDLEKEPLTRGFLLISLGRQGGLNARSYLLEQLKEGPSESRPWTVLALGLFAHDAPDADIAKALREAYTKEKRAEDRAAYLLALGLARDGEAFELLRDELRFAPDPRNRMYAAQALAMLGSDAAHDALAKCVDDEGSTLVRSQIALALGVFGRAGDVDPIMKLLQMVTAPELQGQVAAAVAFHGSSEALQRIGHMVAVEHVDSSVRAAALDALGMLLSRGQALTFSASAHSTNFTLYTDWFESAVSTTL